MKNLIVLFLSVLLVSCSNLPDYENMKKSTFPETNPQLEEIKEDIASKNASLSNDARLNLVMIDFAFQYPAEYNALLEHSVVVEKSRLMENNHIIELCEKRNVNTSLIEEVMIFRRINSERNQDSIVLEKQDIDKLLKLANGQIQKEFHKKAIPYLDKCILADSNNSEALFLRGYCKFNLNTVEFGYDDCKRSAQLGNAKAIKMLKTCWKENP